MGWKSACRMRKTRSLLLRRIRDMTINRFCQMRRLPAGTPSIHLFQPCTLQTTRTLCSTLPSLDYFHTDQMATIPLPSHSSSHHRHIMLFYQTLLLTLILTAYMASRFVSWTRRQPVRNIRRDNCRYTYLWPFVPSLLGWFCDDDEPYPFLC